MLSRTNLSELEPAAQAPAGPRIGIIGNMNNAGFTMMRYFRDMGADAYLLPLTTDISGAHVHFTPEADTWEIQRWRPFIRPLPIAGDRTALLGDPRRLQPPPSPRLVRSLLSRYDRLVGSGVAAALLERAGMKLDIFYPFGIGVEFYGDHAFVARMNSHWARKIAHKRIRTLQARGIRNARYCLNAELSVTRESLEEIGKDFLKIGIPAVYNREQARRELLPEECRRVLTRIEQADFSAFCAARHVWVRDPAIKAEHWHRFTKNSDWAIRGFKIFADRHPEANVVLVMTEYGPDVAASKALVSELGLDGRIEWLPIRPRREIMALLQAASVGIGQFYADRGVLWGGTGWEVLAAGRPMVHRLGFTADEFMAAYGCEPPAMLDSNSVDEIADNFSAMLADAERQEAIGASAARWFDSNGGVGLARKWLDLLQFEDGQAAA